MDVSKFVEWIKLKPRHLIGVIIGTGFLLFVPSRVLKYLDLNSLVESIRPLLSLAFVIFCALLLGALLANIGSFGGSVFSIWLKTVQYKSRLKDLTREEKDILKSYLDNDTRSHIFNMTNGVVLGLVHDKILYQSTRMLSGITLSYNIQPWAWRYLKKNRDLLD